MEFQASHLSSLITIIIRGDLPGTAVQWAFTSEWALTASAEGNGWLALGMFTPIMSEAIISNLRTFNPFVFSLVIQTQVDGFSFSFLFPPCP